MKFVLAAVFALSAFSAFADDCSNAETTYDMKICLSQNLDKEDVRLNSVYKQLTKKLDKIGLEKLRKAQKAWIVYRDANCELVADSNRGGTLEGVVALSCLSEMTKKRADEIKQLLDVSSL